MIAIRKAARVVVLATQARDLCAANEYAMRLRRWTTSPSLKSREGGSAGWAEQCGNRRE
jgi:hypothetical protein